MFERIGHIELLTGAVERRVACHDNALARARCKAIVAAR